jgi:hypothetical protein
MLTGSGANVTEYSATITTGATAHTVGAWTQIIASTSAELCGLLVRPNSSVPNIDTVLLFDVGIGPGGSEVVIASDLDGGFHPTSREYIPLPVLIPAGSRIAIRARSVRTSQSVGFVVAGIGRSLTDPSYTPPSTLVTIGAVTASSCGTALAAGSWTAKGAWTELTAACPKTLVAVVPLANALGDTWATQFNNIDIAVGASGSEVAVISNYRVSLGNNEQILRYLPLVPLPVNIPEGARISARYARSVSSVTGSLSLIGVPL